MVGRMLRRRRAGRTPCPAPARRRRAGLCSRPPSRGCAADHRMLAALAVAREIGIGAVRRRHRGVVLLDAAVHLGEQRLLQRLGVGERRLRHRRSRPRDRRGCRRRAPTGRASRLPVVGAQPSIVVGQRDAVPGRRSRAALRARGAAGKCAVEHRGSGDCGSWPGAGIGRCGSPLSLVRRSNSAPSRSCSSAGRSASARRETRGRDAHRSSRSGPRCAA